MSSVYNEVSIRKLKPEDVDAISEIYTLITKKYAKDEFKGLVDGYALNSEHEALFVADLNGVAIGFMISYIITLGFGAEKSAYIVTLGIHPQYMGQGIGAKMAREIFEFYKSKGIKRVYTSTEWDSTDMISFFKIMNFERSKFINLKKNLAPMIEDGQII